MDLPIPDMKMPNYKNVKIEDNKEPLVAVNNDHPKLMWEALYKKCRIEGALDQIYVRSSILNKLIQAANMLPPHVFLLVWDGWRPEIVHKKLYNTFLESGDYSEEEIEIYIPKPANNPHTPIPHSTGGCVCVTLCDKNKELFYMGTSLDEFDKRTATNYFELHEYNKEAQYNRRMLYYAMCQAGFVNNPNMWWQYSFGDQLWASVTGANKAVYGKI